MRIGYNRKFLKQFENAPKNIKGLFKEQIRVFAIDKFNISLNNHQLKGKVKHLRSINIGGDWRALFEELSNGDVIFKAIGTHGKLYGK
jgi:mRNA-degrading endonuclease YafQ of YafQ-DinJ toxin-antitoxin module